MVAEIKTYGNKMSSSPLEPLPLNPEFYAFWKKEMCLWQLTTNIPPTRRTPAVFLSLKSQAHTAILEMDIALLHSDDGMDKLIKKLDTLFLEDKNHSAFVCYKKFESYHHEPYISINDYGGKFTGKQVYRMKCQYFGSFAFFTLKPYM